VTVCWGIDVSATALHCVAVDERLRLVDSGVFDAGDIGSLRDRIAGAAVVAIDAPASLSTEPHRNDRAISRKFQAARCGEVALGRDRGYWVPWVSPVDEPPGWMRVGLELYAAVEAEAGSTAIEVYPHACFRELAHGARLPKKTTAAGVVRRVELLREVGLDTPSLQMWSHDALDAAVAAVTAAELHQGAAAKVTCRAGDDIDHDGSAIWLPVPGPPKPARVELTTL
jgi:predicted nuclease with RNAse H fold